MCPDLEPEKWPIIGIPNWYKSPTTSNVLWTTNSFSLRVPSGFMTVSPWTATAFSKEAPRANPMERNISNSSTKPNVRAYATESLKARGDNVMEYSCRPIARDFLKSIMKSIVKSLSAGYKQTSAPFPSSKTTSFKILTAFNGASWFKMPAHSIKVTKSAADPSIKGTSAPSNSTNTLVMPIPPRAPIRCSIVATVTPAAFPKHEHIRVSTMWSYLAGILLSLSVMSVRTNTTPVPTGAGRRVMWIFWPLCSPIPTQGIALCNVFSQFLYKVIVCISAFI